MPVSFVNFCASSFSDLASSPIAQTFNTLESPEFASSFDPPHAINTKLSDNTKAKTTNIFFFMIFPPFFVFFKAT